MLNRQIKKLPTNLMTIHATNATLKSSALFDLICTRFPPESPIYLYTNIFVFMVLQELLESSLHYISLFNSYQVAHQYLLFFSVFFFSILLKLDQETPFVAPSYFKELSRALQQTSYLPPSLQEPPQPPVLSFSVPRRPLPTSCSLGEFESSILPLIRKISLIEYLLRSLS